MTKKPKNHGFKKLSSKFESALIFATKLHATQTRKGNDVPYISHLMAVSGLVLEAGGTEDEAIAALLHDAAEDQGGKKMLKRIRSHYGDAVAEIVDQCTDAYSKPKPPWRKRKEKYIADIPHKTPSARLVSLADKVHNAQAILRDYKVVGEELWDRFNGTKENTLWYYRELAEKFKENMKSPLVSELDQIVKAIYDLAGGGR